MELQRLEAKGAMADVDSGDEYSQDLETTPLKERFSIRMLVHPISDVPTKISGIIVYSATGTICKHFHWSHFYDSFFLLHVTVKLSSENCKLINLLFTK